MGFVDNLITWMPILMGCPGTSPFNAKELDDWACTLGDNSASRHAARFVLSVYSDQPWRCGRFDALAAIDAWGHPEQVGFVRWAQVPYTLSAAWPGQQLRAE